MILFGLFFLGVSLLLFNSSVQRTEGSTGIADNQKVYEQDEMDSLKEIYITVLPETDQSSKFAHTFQELNQKIDEDIEVRVIFQEGTDGSPKAGYFGYGLTDANATLKLRGQSSRLKEQKSYQVKLNKKGGLWEGFQTINLNKHPFDNTKIRNKLTFDYLKEVPGITSLRTQFVHLFIKDLSEGDFSNNFKDYGLFTHVENVDQDFLENHGLNPKGALYKAEQFEFYRYPEQLKRKGDPDYDQDVFEELLEIKGDDDHEKLLTMLNDVNNEFIHINDVIDKHFDRDNYLTWLAINILIDNVDTNSKNFYLYSPRDSNKWYFLPWDYDKGWSRHRFENDQVGLWQEGISNYWGVVLHRRFFKNDQNIEDLSNKIEELSAIFTEEKTEELLNAYRPIVTYFLNREPDNLEIDADDDVLGEIDRLPGVIKASKEKYYKNSQALLRTF